METESKDLDLPESPEFPKQKFQQIWVLGKMIEISYQNEGGGDWPRHNLRFSDAGISLIDSDKCERAVILDLYHTWLITNDKPGIRSGYKAGTLAVFDDGRQGERDIRRRLVDVLQSPEKPMTNKATGAKGKLDNRAAIEKIRGELASQLQLETTDPVLQKCPVVEIKTCNQYKFDTMVNTCAPAVEYFDQVQLYLHEEKLPFAILFIKNRNGFGQTGVEIPYLEFVIWSDPERQAEILAGFSKTWRAWKRIEKRLPTENILEDKDLPKRPFVRQSSSCKYCRVHKACWGKEPEEPATSTTKKEGVEPPSKELLESALKGYRVIHEQISELKGEKDELYGVLIRYFEATGEKQLIIGDIRATASEKKQTEIDTEILRNLLTKAQFLRVVDPVRKKVDMLIAAREIDAGVMEQALRETGEKTTSITVTRMKPKTHKIPKEKKAKKETKNAD